MDIRFLPILLNQTLSSFGQSQSSNPTSSDFSNLLTESLLKAEALKNANSSQPFSTNNVTNLNMFPSLLGFSSSLVDLLGMTNSLTGNGGSFSSVNDLSQLQGNWTSPLSSPFLGNGNSLQSTSTQAHELNAQLKGVLRNTGDLFVEAGKKYNISPALLAAVSIHETGNGSSNAARYKFNVAGMMGKNGLKTYSSIGESIFDMARNLRQNYLDKGLTTISQIGAKYAPIGVANDPTNLNNHWVTGVQRQFETLTKTTDFA